MEVIFGIKLFRKNKNNKVIQQFNSVVNNNLPKGISKYISYCESVMICGSDHNEYAKESVLFIAGDIFDFPLPSNSISSLNRLLNQNNNFYDSLKNINGRFSLVHFNEKQDRLIIAKDQFGIKSIYYAEFNDGIIFASDLSYIFASNLIQYSFSPKIFLLNSTVRMDAVSDLTWFDGVNQLEPATCLVIGKNNRPKITRYWIPDNQEKLFSEQDMCEMFINSVKLRANFSNQGVLLSGGVDSSAVASVLFKLNKDVSLCMFSFDGLAEKDNIDLVYAKKFLKYYKKTGKTIHIEKKDLYETLRVIVSILKRPLVHGCEIGMYHTYKLMSEIGCKVIYTGQGADIMWGEQDSQYFPILSPDFRVEQHSEYYLKNLLYQNDTADWYNFLIHKFYKFFDIEEEQINDMIWNKIFSSYRAYNTDDLFKKPRIHELHRNVAYINHMNDSFTSYFGMKEIPSFQDLNLANASFKLPEFIKNKPNKYFLKPFLKNAFETILPEFILKRKKYGFPAPNINDWKKELVVILKDNNTPFNLKIKNSDLQQMTFSELLFLCTTKIWLEEFKLL